MLVHAPSDLLGLRSSLVGDMCLCSIAGDVVITVGMAKVMGIVRLLFISYQYYATAVTFEYVMINMSNFKLHPMLRLVHSCLGNFLLISHVGAGYCNAVRIGQKNNWITLLSIISRLP